MVERAGKEFREDGDNVHPHNVRRVHQPRGALPESARPAACFMIARVMIAPVMID